MTEVQKNNFKTQLWSIANLLRGKISADDIFFRLDYKSINKLKKQIEQINLFKKGLLQRMFV